MSDHASASRISDPANAPLALQGLRRDGYWIARGLLDADKVIDTLVALDRLLCARDRSLRASLRANVAAEIHGKIAALARTNRSEVGRVYDAVRKALPFWNIVGSEAISRAAQQLLQTDHIGVAFRGAGIRIDLPNEDRWRSEWHQEYHSQISSPHGVVAWFAFTAVDEAMGPVQLATGSHQLGILPVRCLDPMNKGTDYTQTFAFENVSALLEQYPTASFATEPGDVVFLDFLLLHRSGFNRSPLGHSRITGQVRYFDMDHPTAIKNAWQGGWQDGGDFTQLHPEKVLP
jgi:ectoine hydroxylase-related dioxygenase (phytanoyl-CoA dioxygenase family)